MNQSKLYQNRTVVITGASSGFGEAMAKVFSSSGADLVLIARRQDKLNLLAQKLKQENGTSVHVLGLDITDYKSLEKSLNELPKQFYTPDLLINNAGMVRGLNTVWETNESDIDQMFDVNVKALLKISSILIPRMLKKNRGQIINVGSISGYDTYAGGGIYCATKFALRAITDTLRKELVATPIRVSMISPGMAETEFSLVRFSGDKKKADAVYDNIEALKAEDVAEIALFMATRPDHVNIADVIVCPTNQASVSLLHRRTS